MESYCVSNAPTGSVGAFFATPKISPVRDREQVVRIGFFDTPGKNAQEKSIDREGKNEFVFPLKAEKTAFFRF